MEPLSVCFINCCRNLRNFGKGKAFYSLQTRSYSISHKVLEGKASNEPPFLMAHGLMGNKNNFNSLSKWLNEKTGRKVITYDARNHGSSGHCDTMTLEEMRDDAIGILDLLNIKKCIFLGHSMGGRVALFTALTEILWDIAIYLMMVKKGKLSFEQQRHVGDQFMNYLEINKLVKPYAKPELKSIHEKFRREAIDVEYRQNVCYSTILYVLARLKPVKVYVKNGYVTFKKERGERNNFRQYGYLYATEEMQSQRKKISEVLKATKRKDSLLTSNYVELSVKPSHVEDNPGYFTCDLDQQKEFRVKIKNISGGDIWLMKCFFLRDSSYMSLSDEHQCTSPDPSCIIKMPPNAVYRVTVSCSALDQVGSYISDLFFRFDFPESNESFYVLRYIRFFKSDEVVEMLKPIAPYRKQAMPVMEPSIDIVQGEKPYFDETQNRLVIKRQLPPCHIPRDVAAAFVRGLFRSVDDRHNRGEIPAMNPRDEKLLELLSDELTFENYSKKFSLLLHIEEGQAQIDIRHYSLQSASVEQRGRQFALKVPGLAERRPSVLRGDRIFLRQKWRDDLYENREYEGYVHRVNRDDVELGFNRRFLESCYIKGMKFYVRFSFNRLPMKVEHRAVDDCRSEAMKNILFPVGNIGERLPAFDNTSSFYDRNIDTNEEQKMAVWAIMQGKSKAPYIIYGPPGTGKTVTMVEAIKQVVNSLKKRVLVCAPSNDACDLLVQRLSLSGRYHGHLGARKILRMHALSRNWEYVPDDVKKVSNRCAAISEDYYFPSKEELNEKQVVVTTLITAGRLSSGMVDPFDYVFVDEAGHAVEPEFMIAVNNLLAPNGRLVLAGDPKQLGPVLRSYAAKENGLEISYLERLMESIDVYQKSHYGYDHRVITKLCNNYRSHKAIMDVSNECFYDNELIECADEMLRTQFCEWEHLPAKGFPIIFHGIRGADTREANSPSYFNGQEASMIGNYLMKIFETRRSPVRPEDIGIITPYRKQVEKLRQMVKGKRFRNYIPNQVDLKIGTVEEFQGQERLVILMSTVRSNSKHLVNDEKFQLGFLRNPKRFNVALTRAKSLLIVVGNPEILCRDYYWHRFIKYCYENGGYVGLSFRPPADPKGYNDVKSYEEHSGDVSGVQAMIDPPYVDRI